MWEAQTIKITCDSHMSILYVSCMKFQTKIYVLSKNRRTKQQKRAQ
jgi:hypothetical protein